MTNPFHVLVAEDSGTVRDILSFLLQENGYDTTVAEDGVAAIQAILRCPPDLVLLDVDMPKMNGYQVCRLVKADPSLSDIPVVMLTSRDRKLDRMWGLSTGADAYVIKAMDDDDEPFGELGSIMDTQLAGRQPRLRTAAEAPAVSEAEVLDRLNGMLDQMLFRMTLRRRVGDLAQELQDLSQTIRSIIGVLEQAADFQGFALAVRRTERSGHLWLHGRDDTSPPSLDALAQRARAELEQAFDGVLDLDCEHLSSCDTGTLPLETFISFPLRARLATIGVAVFGFRSTAPVDPIVRETLGLVLDHAALVVDNALLFAGLERSNRELQRTLDELTTTQVKLAKSEVKVQQLEIMIDEGKKKKKVAEIVESEYFESLKARVLKLRGS